MMQFEHLADGFSAVNLRACAAAAALAYSAPAAIGLACNAWGFGKFRFIENHTAGAQCFVAGNDKMILVAFRGTDEISDWISDLDCELAPMFGMRLHEGFYTQLRSVWSELSNAIAEFRNGCQRIWVTGHSLGGALAALAALLILKIEHRPIAGGYTFGQPRVGDRDFARKFDAALAPHFFRVVHECDVVPRLPRLAWHLPPTWFRHGGTEVYLGANGRTYFDLPAWRKLPGDVLDFCHELRAGKLSLLADHAMAKYQARALTA